jgi:Zn-finger protein
MISTINKGCTYYPCHDKDKLESCVFCYCYRWPCNDTSLGYYLENGVWDCSNCTWPHERIRVNELFDYLKNNWE